MAALSAEYSSLAAARSATVFEANGRITIFLSTASSVVVALAFIGQASRLGAPFFVFAFVLLPTVFLIGTTTYVRVLQTGLEDLLVSRAMARIRHYFIELDDRAGRYYLLVGNDDHLGHLRNMGIDLRRPQLPFTAATMIAVVNCVVAGVLAALVVAAVGGGLELSAGMGVASGAIVAAAFLVHQASQWRIAERSTPSLFPSDPGVEVGRRDDEDRGTGIGEWVRSAGRSRVGA